VCALGACHMKDRRPLAPKPATVQKVVIVPRIQELPEYPCSGCHAGRTPNPKRRRLTAFHVIRNQDFQHGERAFWCYQCHSIQNIDMLRTAAGKLVSFNEAYRICLSCHGDKLHDFREGIHSRSTGFWDGERFRRSCPACHNPHNPQFAPMKPQKPPPPPRSLHAL
jgi:hypothetical protein